MSAALESYAVEVAMGSLGLRLERTGLRDYLRDILHDLDGDGEDAQHLQQWLSGPRILPDAWGVLERRDIDTLVLLEVEDTSKLSEWKLDIYADLWSFFDRFNDRGLSLKVVDRYGHDEREINLFLWTYSQF